MHEGSFARISAYSSTTGLLKDHGKPLPAGTRVNSAAWLSRLQGRHDEAHLHGVAPVYVQAKARAEGRV
jgi:hypothetical protein